MLGAVSDALLMPGSVGLVAVDSFALGTPIITTRWPYHGPEIVYLEDGVNARISGNSIGEFAEMVEGTLLDREQLVRLQAECATASGRFHLDRMVSNFSGGLIAALETPRR